jgi:ferredoxin
MDTTVQIGKYKVTVLRDLCIGATTCVAVAPGTFEMDGENKAVIKAGSPDAEATVLMAAQACPARAVTVVDTETGAQVWPV